MDVDQPSNPGPFVSLKDKSIYVVSPYSHVNTFKQIENLVLQTSDLREKNPYSGDHEEERPVKKRKLTEELAEENNNNNNAKRRKMDLPEALFRVIEEPEDFVPFFLRPKSYIRFKENPFAEIIDDDDTRIEYELDSDDETFLSNYNKKMENDQKEALKLNNEAFEHIVDVCEKEAFKLTMDKLKENEIEAAHKVCTVCKDGSSDDNNQIIFCDGCDMAVHQACYGVRSIPEGTWFCELCDIGIGPDHACKFCGQTGGAQKKTAVPHRNEYVHVQCALWLPECHFKEDDCYGPVYYRKEIDKDRYRLQCNICNKRVGAPIQCSDKKCFTSFHITCAQDKCYVLEMEESEQGVDFFAWCPKHTPPELKEKREKMIKDAEKRELSRKRAEVMKKQEEQVMLLNPKHFEHEKFCGGLELDRVKKNVRAVQPQTCSHIFRYWAEKRKRRRGLPLIKRFQPSVLKLAPPPPRLEDMSQENMIQGRKVMTSLRERLEKLRLMLDLVVKREKVKQRLMQIQTERFEGTMLTENVRWRAIVSALEAEDTSGLFLEPVSTHLAPDYYDIIKTPMSFYDIRNKINNCEYKSDEEFWADVALIFSNAKVYNKEDTFVYEEAVRIEAVVARAKKDLISEQVPIITKRAREQVEPVKKPVSTKKAPIEDTPNNTNNNTNVREDQNVIAIDDKQSVVPHIDAMNSSFAGEPLTGVNTSFPLLNTVNDLNMSNVDPVNDSTAVNLSLNYGKYLNNDLGDDLNGSDWAKIDPDSSINIEDFLNTSVTTNNSNNKKEDVEMKDAENSKKNEGDAANQSVEANNSSALMTPPGSAVKKSATNKKAVNSKSSPTTKSSKTPSKKSTSQSDNSKEEAVNNPVEISPAETTTKEDKEKSPNKNQNSSAATNSPKNDTKTSRRMSPKTNKKNSGDKTQSDNNTNYTTSQRESEVEKKDEMEVSEEKDTKKESNNSANEKSTAKSSSKKISSASESTSKKSNAAATPNGHVSTSSDKKKNSASANKESPTKNSAAEKTSSKSKASEEKKKEPASDPSPKNTSNNNTKTPAKSEQKKEPASEGTKSTKKSTKSQNEKVTANDTITEKEKEREEKDVQMNGVHEKEPATPSKKTSPKKATSSPKTTTKKADPKSSKKTEAKNSEPETKTPQKKSNATSKNSSNNKNDNKSDENKNNEPSPKKTESKTPKKSDTKNGKTKSTT